MEMIALVSDSTLNICIVPVCTFHFDGCFKTMFFLFNKQMQANQ